MGRRKFIAKALAALRIFKTDVYHQRYHAQAHINLQREMEELA
jgi:predicted metal-dependent HD superfamily phosphohydrolase